MTNHMYVFFDKFPTLVKTTTAYEWCLCLYSKIQISLHGFSLFFLVSLRSLLPCTIFCKSRTLIFLQTHHTLISSGSYALLFILQLYLSPPQPTSLNLKSELDISLQFFYSALCISLITLHCDLLVGLPFCLSTLTPGMQK